MVLSVEGVEKGQTVPVEFRGQVLPKDLTEGDLKALAQEYADILGLSSDQVYAFLMALNGGPNGRGFSQETTSAITNHTVIGGVDTGLLAGGEWANGEMGLRWSDGSAITQDDLRGSPELTARVALLHFQRALESSNGNFTQALNFYFTGALDKPVDPRDEAFVNGVVAGKTEYNPLESNSRRQAAIEPDESAQRQRRRPTTPTPTLAPGRQAVFTPPPEIEGETETVKGGALPTSFPGPGKLPPVLTGGGGSVAELDAMFDFQTIKRDWKKIDVSMFKDRPMPSTVEGRVALLKEIIAQTGLPAAAQAALLTIALDEATTNLDKVGHDGGNGIGPFSLYVGPGHDKAIDPYLTLTPIDSHPTLNPIEQYGMVGALGVNALYEGMVFGEKAGAGWLSTTLGIHQTGQPDNLFGGTPGATTYDIINLFNGNHGTGKDHYR